MTLNSMVFPRRAARTWSGFLALCLAPAALAGCAVDQGLEGELGSKTEAATVVNCGYTVTAKIGKTNKKGFKAKLKVKDLKQIQTTGLTVFVSAGAAKLVHVAHGTFTAVDGGYLLSTVPAAESLDDMEDTDSDVLGGKAYRFNLKFEGEYTQLVTYVVSSSGSNCDQTAPTVQLTASEDFFTAPGTLSLSAVAADDVALTKVVFAQDGVTLGTDTSAPFTFAVPVTAALNGRHRYTATAYDLTGNQASETVRALVAIDNQFFGTAVTTAADYVDIPAHFEQITPGNAGKWGSVEATRDQMNWTDLDTAYDYAEENGVVFKLHTLVWGQQQPAWIAGLSESEQLAEIDEWMGALAERYPNVKLIDVVNEPLHAPPSYAAALGGAGETGWDWVVTAFEMARQHFPNAELILNDYAVLTMASTTADYLEIVQVLQERGLIDGIGEQGHFYERAPELSVLETNLGALSATGLPLYITELDLNFADDARQAGRMRDVFTIFSSNPSVLGITHWGHLQGNMWQTDAYLIRTDKSLRPALTWIECYRAGNESCPVPEIVPVPHTGDQSGITLEAEQYDSAHNLLPAGNVVAYASDGSWFGYDQVVFNANWDTLSVTYANGGSSPISLSVHLGSVGSAAVATVPLAPTGGWGTLQTVSIPWAPIATTNNLLVKFNGGGSNVDKIAFVAPTGTGLNVVTDSDFEQGTTGGFFSWAAGTIANTTARAASGARSLAMTGRTGNSPLAKQITSSVLPGKTYKVSLRATIGGATSPLKVSTALQCTGGSTEYGQLGGWDNTKTVTDGTWVEFAGDLVVPDCPLANVQLWLEGPGAGVDLYLDHFSVRQVTSSNIVQNGTFESGTSGWYTYGGTATATATTERFHGGTKSLLIAPRTGNSPAVSDLTSVIKAGTNYPFSLWASLKSPDGSAMAINVTQAVTCQGSSPVYTWIAGPTSVPGGATATWVQFSGTLSIPNCTVTQVQLFVEGGAGSDLYVDDVQILDNSGASSNLIPDGTFESSQGAWGGWGYGTLARISTSAHGGSWSLKGTTMNFGAIGRDIKALVAPGKRYQATAWVSVEALAAGSGAVRLQTIQRCNGASGDSYPWLQGDTVSNGSWKQLTGVVDLTGCSSIENLLLFVGADSGDLLIDDVSLVPLP